MSKCTITIEFDRDDRTYQGGETVNGTVRIVVHDDLNCNGIKLTHYWHTHGSGNTDSGDRQEQTLSAGCELRGGDTRDFPFSFVADCQPVTYRGHHVNIDHYVRVDVDVPWAFDPKAEEEYILRPGRRPTQMTGRRDEIVTFEPESSTESSTIGKIILAIIVVVFLVAFSLMAIILIPVFLVGLAIYFIWRKAIASRVGNVQVRMPHVVVGPGEQWPLEIHFTPRKTFEINGITLKLFAQESATSGSGTNKTTYHHTIFERVHTLQPAETLFAGQPVHKQLTIPFPETEAYSFDESDNDVEWSAEVRIDIPRFPDWKKKQVLQVVPNEFLEDSEADAEPMVPPSAAPQFEQPQGTTEEWSASNAAPPQDPVYDEIAGQPTAAGDSAAAIVTLMREILQASRFGNERAAIAARARGEVFEVEVAIDRVASTFASAEGDRYENGKTITGAIVGGDPRRATIHPQPEQLTSRWSVAW